MKILRGFITTILILIIIGGIGYLAWNIYFMPNMGQTGTNVQPDNQTITGNQNNQHNMGNDTENNLLPNTIAIQNKDRLNQAIGTINQAIELITIDPYARTTVPRVNENNPNANGAMQQPTIGPGTINIYPDGSSSVNIAPSGNITPNNQMPSIDTNVGNMNPLPNSNYVFDQGKLQQLHSGIFTLAQGLMIMSELNDDLTQQSTLSEASPATYQTYITRYNLALQNKTKLNNAISMLEQASVLININPYGAPGGYQINLDAMGQLHQGIYKLAQGMALLTRLNDDLTMQMGQAAQLAQMTISNQNTMNNDMPVGFNLFGMNISTIFNIILVIMAASLIIGILGAIISLLRSKPEKIITKE